MTDETTEQEAPKKLTRRELRLCELYLTGLKGAECLRLMRSKGTPQQLADRAYKMLRQPHVKAYLAERRRSDEEEFGLRKEAILRRLNNVATISVKALYDEAGQLIPVHQLPDDVADIISGIDLEELYSGRGSEREPIGVLKKIRTIDPNKAGEVVSRMMGWNKDKLDVNGNLSALPPVIRIAAYDDNDEAERAARAAVSSKQAAT